MKQVFVLVDALESLPRSKGTPYLQLLKFHCICQRSLWETEFTISHPLNGTDEENLRKGLLTEEGTGLKEQSRIGGSPTD